MRLVLFTLARSAARRCLPGSFYPHPHGVALSSRVRQLHSSNTCRDRSFTNLLADDSPPAVQVESISDNGIHLTDGLVINGPCIFLEGRVFLWDVPSPDPSSRTIEERWELWNDKRFELFEVVTPRPEILVLGTGKTLLQPPSIARECLRKLGMQLEVMDTRNACSTYNLLTEEGRRVAAALLPLSPHPWQKLKIGSGISQGPFFSQ